MRILQLAPLWERVPPPAYGGTEYVVSTLTEELVRTGHEVVLVASGDSLTSAELLAAHRHSLRTAKGIKHPLPYTYVHTALALEAAETFDLVHNHAGELPMAMHRLTNTPMLSTLHNLITPDLRWVWDAYRGYYNTPSQAARVGLEYPNFAGVIYHGIDVESFPFRTDRGDYLLFLSRMSPEKGPREAIKVARRLGKRLVMAGKVDDKDHDYFWSEVAPLIDGRLVQYVGEADANYKRHLYSHAYCLLFPIRWNEPFGLVLAEAMACGTPVIAFRQGAAPEVVQNGVSGYLVDDTAEMAEAVKKIERLDPMAIREYVAQRFSVRRMAEAYVRAYAKIVEREAAARRAKMCLLRTPRARTG